MSTSLLASTSSRIWSTVASPSLKVVWMCRIALPKRLLQNLSLPAPEEPARPRSVVPGRAREQQAAPPQTLSRLASHGNRPCSPAPHQLAELPFGTIVHPNPQAPGRRLGDRAVDRAWVLQTAPDVLVCCQAERVA